MLKRVYSVLNAIRTTLIIGILAGTIILSVIQIFLRYFTGPNLRPFPWGDEIVRLSSIWVSFLAASVGVREESHMSVEFFIRRIFPDAAIDVVKKIALVIVLAALALLIWQGILYTDDNWISSLQNLPMSIAWFYAAIPVGCFYLFLEYFLILIFGRHPFAQRKDPLPDDLAAKDLTDKVPTDL